MSLMKGKKGLIMGVANERSIAWGISQKLAEAGAELAFTYLGDALKKRVIPCASLCNGEFGIDGYFIGVPTVIGANGVEKILEFELEKHEQDALNQTLNAVKKTVSETGL